MAGAISSNMYNTVSVDITSHVNQMKQKLQTNPSDVQKTLAQILADFHKATNADLKLLDVIVKDDANPNGKKMSLQEFGKEAIMDHNMPLIMAFQKALKETKFITEEVHPKMSENNMRKAKGQDEMMRMTADTRPFTSGKTPTTNAAMGAAQVAQQNRQDMDRRVNTLKQSPAPQELAQVDIKYNNLKVFRKMLTEEGYYKG